MSAAVTVIGSGDVGATRVGAGGRAGRGVALGPGAPQSEKVQAVRAETGATVAELGDALAAAAVVVLAVPGGAAAGLIRAHDDAFAGTVVIDATNDLSGGAGGPELSSLGALTEVAPTALGYRAFNSVGWEVMADPVLGGVRADLAFAGPDGPERETVEELISDVGFGPVYVGADAAAHRAVDGLMTLWFALAFGQGRGRRLALHLLTD